MSKTEIISVLSTKLDITKVKAEEIFDVFISTIEEGLVSDGEVSIAKFGKFTTKTIKGREGVCHIPIAEGKTWKSEDSVGLSFKVSSVLKNKINGVE